MNNQLHQSGAQAIHLFSETNHAGSASIDDKKITTEAQQWQLMLKHNPTLQERVAKSLGVGTATINALAQEQPATLGIVPQGTQFVTVGTLGNGRPGLIDDALFTDRLAFIYSGAVFVSKPYPGFPDTMKFGCPRAPWRAWDAKPSCPDTLHVSESEALAIKLIDAGEERPGSRVVALRSTMLPIAPYVPHLLASKVFIWLEQATSDASSRFAESLERALGDTGAVVSIRTF
ncbi:hypothetical protein [Roseimicrobium sp. ORNL1]|uniref:hypothetical protein n=1 Tax=Roseimicrobium sp. ORNL1 TaxID=2711231 RepID=UPI0013E102B7|nr:hypothetical protein [Roseimicrobium sp. ORNL1]QIF02897.1 hypothetical protein G5S37_15680 [Roseimicrobium sp. ORNL1]